MPGWGNPCCWLVACKWGKGPKGNSATCSALSGFQSCPPLVTSKLDPSGADSWVGGFVYVAGLCGSLQWTLLWGVEFLPPMQSPQVFSVRGFEGFFSQCWNPGLHGLSHSQFFLLVYLHKNVGPPLSISWCLASPIPPATALLCILSTPAAHLAPPTGLNKCVFNSFIVRLPYSSIFWQLWLFFVFKFVVVLFWLCEEAQCIYLCLHLGWKFPCLCVLDGFFSWVLWSINSKSLYMVFVLKSILFDISVATLAFFFLSFCLEYFFPTLHFQSVLIFYPDMGLL